MVWLIWPKGQLAVILTQNGTKFVHQKRLESFTCCAVYPACGQLFNYLESHYKASKVNVS